MATKNKTTETEVDVKDFINTYVENEQKKTDSFQLIELMTKLSGFEPKMWGPTIIGFGSYHYKYESGHEGEAPLVAFSPRKSEISLYLSSSFENREELLQKFGKHKSATACIYVKRLEDINLDILKKMISLSIKHVKQLHK
jgi:hypothetical protein